MDKLKEALEEIETLECLGFSRSQNSALQSLIVLAKQYLKASECMPENRDEWSPKVDGDIPNQFNYGYNQARDACTLALTKKLDGLEGIVAQGWCTKRNENKIMDADLAFDIANSIREYILK